MLKFSANLSILFTELPFLERFAAARSAGFSAVECWFPYAHDLATVRRALDDNGLTLVGINTASGEAEQWGLAALPGHEAPFERSVVQALAYAHELGRPSIHVMAGLAGHVCAADAQRTYCANMERAVRLAEGSGVTLLIEPLNGRDRPGYFLNSADQAADIIDRTGLQSLRIMFDCYHIQVQQGDVISRLTRHFAKIGHIQIAGVPLRNEPDRGELNCAEVLRVVDRLGWDGYIGAEYRPSGPTADSFGWLHALRREGLAA